MNLPAARAQKTNPWNPRDICIFGMPTIGHAVKANGTGLITDILKEVFEPEHIDLNYVSLPYKRALEELTTGEIHCSLDVKDNRKGVLQGRATMVYYDLSVAYLRKTGWKGVESLAEQKVAYLHGFDIENFLSVKVHPQMVYDLSSAFHMLDRGHVAYVLDDGRLLEDAMYESKLSYGEFEISPIKSMEVRPIFTPTEKGRRFRDIYDRRIKEMIASGKLQEILRSNGLNKNSIEKVLKAN